MPQQQQQLLQDDNVACNGSIYQAIMRWIMPYIGNARSARIIEEGVVLAYVAVVVVVVETWRLGPLEKGFPSKP